MFTESQTAKEETIQNLEYLTELQDLFNNETFLERYCKTNFLPNASSLNELAQAKLKTLSKQEIDQLPKDQSQKLDEIKALYIIPGLEKDFQQKLPTLKPEATALFARVLKETQEKMHDSFVKKAFATWGKSSAPEWYEKSPAHAGIVHFFAYRAEPAKKGRFTNEPTLENFIAYSKEGEDILLNPNPGNNPTLRRSVLFKDQIGQQQLFVNTNNNELYMFFKQENSDFKLITRYPCQGKKFDHIIEKEKKPTLQSTQRQNQLSGAITSEELR